MLYINKITSDPQQQITLTGISGISINMTLRFMPRIQTWMAGFAYNDVSIQGVKVVTNPNILRQWRRVIPFGILCYAASGLDPFRVNDFSNKAANLYLLNSTDINLVEVGFFPTELIQPGTTNAS